MKGSLLQLCYGCVVNPPTDSLWLFLTNLFLYPNLSIIFFSHGFSSLPISIKVERVRDTKRLNNEKPYEEIPNFRLPLQTSEEQYNCSNNSL